KPRTFQQYHYDLPKSFIFRQGISAPFFKACSISRAIEMFSRYHSLLEKYDLIHHIRSVMICILLFGMKNILRESFLPTAFKLQTTPASCLPVVTL
ncbi:MAG: hypothetical protein AB1510_03935, partial [Bacillota bacterium]